MSIGRYREHAYDVFFKAFILIVKVFRDQGKELIFSIITQKLDSSQDPYEIESIVFASKSILEALDKDELSLKFLRKVLATIIANKASNENVILAREVINFINEAAAYLQAYPEIIADVISLLLKIIHNHESLNNLSYKAIFELC